MYEDMGTPRGGILKVESYYRNKGKTRLKVSCSICNKDKELCPDLFDVLQYEFLERGVIPCLCSKKPNYTQQQKLLIIKRKCDDMGYKLIEFPNNITMRGRLGIFNPETNNYWKPIVNDFWNDKSHDPFLNGSGVSRVANNTLRIKQNLPENMLDVYNSEGSWFYECSICSYDEYVQAGLCSGKFKTTLYGINTGMLSCRCSKSPRWTQHQRDYQVKEKLSSWGACLDFEWEGGLYKNSATRVLYTTSCGHKSSPTLGNLLKAKSEICTVCNAHRANNKNGYYKNRQSEDDILYLVGLGEGVVKIGRSFEVRCKYRLNILKKESTSSYELLKTYKGKHLEVYKLEQEILTYLRDLQALINLPFTKEAFTYDKLPEVLKILDESCSVKEVNNGIYR